MYILFSYNIFFNQSLKILNLNFQMREMRNKKIQFIM